MALSSELTSQFAKLYKEEKESSEETVLGTVVEYNGEKYVKFDGSDLLTPVSSTVDSSDGDRVSVLVKDHSATVNGNLSSPSAKLSTVTEMGSKISEFEVIIADSVTTSDLEAERARIDDLEADNATIHDTLTATNAEIETLKADNVTISGKLTANEAEIENLKTTKLDSDIADITYATIGDLEATNAEIYNLSATYGEFESLTTDRFSAIDADIKNLETEKLSATDAEIKYANIDFANIGEAAIENFYAKSGVIQDVVISDGQVTGTLVGVTIKGDLIEGGTIVADKLVIQGEDGLYYKLNTNGETVTSEQTEYNSLSGTIITAKSVTAEKIAVDDLVAFDATIGGFNITDNAIYSGVKESVDNTTRGIYLDNTGQIAFGDASNYLKFYKTSDGEWKLLISAEEMIMSSSGKSVETAISEAEANSIVKSEEQFYKSTSPVSLIGGSWSTSQPTWTEGTYIWRRTAVTYGDGSSEYTPSSSGVCITGNTGAGISSTDITYQAGSSGTTAPTGTWSSSVPSTSASAPYMWTRTIITYTDGTTSTSYSVGSTPEGIDVGGRNLLPNTKTMDGYAFTADVARSEDSEGFAVANYAASDTLDWEVVEVRPLMQLSIVRGKTVTFSLEVRSDEYESINAESNRGFQIILGLCTADSTTRTLYGSKSFYTTPLSDSWQKITWTATLTDDFFSQGSGTIGDTDRFKVQVYKYTLYSMEARKFKLEFGNMATDWTPALEDQEAAVDRAQSAADAAQADVDNLANVTTQKFAELEVTTEGITSEVSKQTARVDQMEESLSTIQQTAEGVSIQIQNIIDNGVDKVTTQTGYTFNDDGLKITKSGQEIENLLDNTGMYVTRSGETILQANNTGVTATDVTVRNYLIIGTHARFEDYGTNRTACFYI